MTHLTYVLLSYGITVVAILTAIIWILLDQRYLRRELARLEQQGIRRRSDKKSQSKLVS